MYKDYLNTKKNIFFFFPTVKSHAHKKPYFFFIFSILGEFWVFCHFSVSFDSVNKISHFLESCCPGLYVEIKIFMENVFFDWLFFLNWKNRDIWPLLIAPPKKNNAFFVNLLLCWYWKCIKKNILPSITAKLVIIVQKSVKNRKFCNFLIITASHKLINNFNKHSVT